MILKPIKPDGALKNWFWLVALLTGFIFSPKSFAESGDPVSFQTVTVGSYLRLSQTFHPVPYYGLIQSQEELDELWGHLEDARNETLLNFHTVPNPPKVDFLQHSVLWYADQGAQASFVELKSLAQSHGILTARFQVVHSDFGSRRLNLWQFPKFTGNLKAIEEHLYDRGP